MPYKDAQLDKIAYLQFYRETIIAHRWYVVENDLAGGWAIGLWPVPVSAYDFQNAEIWPPAIIVADFMIRDIAELVVRHVNGSRGFHETTY